MGTCLVLSMQGVRREAGVFSVPLKHLPNARQILHLVALEADVGPSAEQTGMVRSTDTGPQQGLLKIVRCVYLDWLAVDITCLVPPPSKNSLIRTLPSKARGPMRCVAILVKLPVPAQTPQPVSCRSTWMKGAQGPKSETRARPSKRKLGPRKHYSGRLGWGRRYKRFMANYGWEPHRDEKEVVISNQLPGATKTPFNYASVQQIF